MKTIRIFIVMFAMTFAMPNEGFSQGIWGALEKALDVVDVVTSRSSKETITTTSTDGYSTSSSSYNDTSYSSNSTASGVTTNHPDFNINITRCAVSGRTCVIDLVMENTGSNDVHIKFAEIVAYDNEGNEYQDISIVVGNDSNKWIDQIDKDLMSGVPVKARLTINGVSESATTIRRINWTTYSNAWNLSFNKPLKFQNISISR